MDLSKQGHIANVQVSRLSHLVTASHVALSSAPKSGVP